MSCQHKDCNRFGKSLYLIGNIPIDLCDTHRRVWHKLVSATPEWEKLCEAEEYATVQMTALKNSSNDINNLKAMALNSLGLYRLAENAVIELAWKWLEENTINFKSKDFT